MKVIKNTILDLINQAQKLGAKIEYYVRKDGGVRIKSINGVRYEGSKGNNALRTLMNKPMSEKMVMQRVSNIRKIQRKRQEKKLPKEIREKFEELHKAWEKSERTTPEPNINNWRKQLEIEHKSQRKIIQDMESQRRLYMNMADINDVDRCENRWNSTHSNLATDFINAAMMEYFAAMRERISKLSKTVADQIAEWCYDTELAPLDVMNRTRKKLIEVGVITEQEGF